MPLRRYAHYLHLLTQSSPKSPVPPPLLLLRPAHGNELAASGSKELIRRAHRTAYTLTSVCGERLPNELPEPAEVSSPTH